MYRNLGIILLSGVIVLSGCSPFGQNNEEFVDEELGEEHVVELSPRVNTAENYYRSVLYDGKYTHGEARGFSTAVVYNRLDLEQLELGLTTLAQEHFSPDKYYFREGTIIKKDELNSWLMRYDDTADRNDRPRNPYGLNPALGEGATLKEQEESQPRFLSHILEHNYMVENENGQLELAGVVIGVSLNSVYHFRVEDEQGRYYFYSTKLDPAEVEAAAKEAAAEIVNRLRNEAREEGKVQNVPIVVALFQEQEQDSAIPGNFIAKAVAEPARSLERWQKINEKYYLFPSTPATQEQRNDSERFMKIREEISSFFDNYIGVVGKGFYQNEQLRELTIEVPIRYYGKTEVVALSQFIADRIVQRFPANLQIQVYVTSTGRHESIIIKNPNQEPMIHIYR